MKKTKILLWVIVLIIILAGCVLGIANKEYIKTLLQNTPQSYSGIVSVVDTTAKIIKREDVGQEFKWNLAEMYANTGELQADIDKEAGMIKELATYKGKMNNDEDLLKYLELNTDCLLVDDKVWTYISLWGSIDTKTTDIDSIKQISNTVWSDYKQSTAFFDAELKEFSDEKLDELINTPKFADYKNVFIDIKIQKKRILPEEQQQLVTRLTDGRIASADIHDSLIDGDIEYPVIKDMQGNEIPTNYANMYSVWGGQTQPIRSEFTNLYYTTYAKYKRTLGALLTSHIKEVTALAKIHNYDSVLQNIYENRELPLEIYDNLIATTKKNIDVFHRYMQMKKDYFGFDELHYYDVFLPMIDSAKSSFTYEQAQDYLLTGLSKLGTTYQELLKTAFASNWVDVYQSDTKAGGAYATSYYGEHPFLLLNFNNTFGDIKTFAHEMGHATNFYLAMDAQPAPLFGTSYPVEIPSITNELVLLRGLAETATSDTEKLLYLDQYLDTMVGNYWRATMYADFEKQMYTKAWDDEPITTDIMDQTFAGLFKQYYGPAMTYDDYLSIEWAIKPHFYSTYYTHVYAISLAAANKIATEIYNQTPGFTEKYFTYLGMGDNGMPAEQLATLGIDMTKPEYIESVSDTMKEILDEMDVLIARIQTEDK